MPGLLDTSRAPFSIDDFLAAEQQKDLLRFSTAGSVDDGKSTLIGRLLYDSRNVYEDQVRAVTGAPIAGREPAIDFARLTDGLRAEREQGITIDVAYRYFSTERRKFIIADTPGHEQYTRNMATGASTADLAIILVDARKGILIQSRRHAYIASLLGIHHLVVAVNKMDLVDFSEDVFRAIEIEFAALVRQLGGQSLLTLPVSALNGDNVVERSTRTEWYEGPTLLEHLETVPSRVGGDVAPFLLPVQRVIRPNQSYRGVAGQITSGTVRPGDQVVALPSRRTSRVAAITTYDGDLEQASAPRSIALTLEDELDISRGDVLASTDRPPQQADAVEAWLVWFAGERLESERPYLLKHGTQTIAARIIRVLYRVNIHSLEEEAVHTLSMNEIGVAEIAMTRPIFFEPYSASRSAGSFILIDPATNSTLAAGMIRAGVEVGEVARYKPSTVVAANDAQASALESALTAEGCAVVRTQIESEATLRAVMQVGVFVIVTGTDREIAGALLLGKEQSAADAVTLLRQLGRLPEREETQLG